MGLIEACRGRQVYLDTNVFIYAVEGSPEHMPVLRPLFELLATGDAFAVTSELTLAEVLPRPLATDRPDIAIIYERMLAVAGQENRPACGCPQRFAIGSAPLRVVKPDLHSKGNWV